MLQKYGATLLSYIGVGCVAAAVSSGVFTETRTLVMIAVGVLCYLAGQYFASTAHPHPIKNVVLGAVFALSIGMVTGGVQYFLDTPVRSMRVVPVGFCVSLIAFAWQHMTAKDTFMDTMYPAIVNGLIGAVVIAAMMFGFRVTIPSTWYSDLAGDNANHKVKPGVFTTLRRNMIPMRRDGSGMDMSHMHILSEREFVTEMIPHHQEAIDTTTALLRITQNPDLQKLGEQIITAQTQEVAMMQSWLTGTTLSGAATIPTYTKMMRDTSMLSASSTIERMWTEDMILHHQGAIHMAQAVLMLRPSAKVAEFANRIIRAQTAEIAQMQEILGGDAAAVSGNDMMMSGHMMHH